MHFVPSEYLRAKQNCIEGILQKFNKGSNKIHEEKFSLKVPIEDMGTNLSLVAFPPINNDLNLLFRRFT